ncbi:hypothetical protein KCP75_17520 [Salmonella enterica subsp. enterica]|nr:hypothetical protein KCP75_17520 [Salmonella enterica subsp. enterica]
MRITPRRPRRTKPSLTVAPCGVAGEYTRACVVPDGMPDGPVPFRHPAGYHHLDFTRNSELSHSCCRSRQRTSTQSGSNRQDVRARWLMLFNAIIGKPEAANMRCCWCAASFIMWALRSMPSLLISGVFIGMVLGPSTFGSDHHSAETSSAC